MQKYPSVLNPIAVDALKEISSICAGNAATALSQFVNRKVEMSPPEIVVADINEVPILVSKEIPTIMTITLGIVGDICGHMLVIFERDHAISLIDLLIGDAFGSPTTTLTEMGISALNEVASVMSGSFLRVLSDILNKILKMTPPDFSAGMSKRVSDFVVRHSIKEGEFTICLKSNLFVVDVGKLSVFLVFVPLSASLTELLKLLGMEAAGSNQPNS